MLQSASELTLKYVKITAKFSFGETTTFSLQIGLFSAFNFFILLHNRVREPLGQE